MAVSSYNVIFNKADNRLQLYQVARIVFAVVKYPYRLIPTEKL